MDPILAQIILWPGTFIPSGWMLCDGSKMQISTNAALYSLLGCTYGGDGQNYFNLPDLRGVAPIGVDPRSSATTLGHTVGAATADFTAASSAQFTIAAANLPGHTHDASFAPGTSPSVTVNCNVAVPVLANPDPTQKAQATNTPGTGTVLTAPSVATTKCYSPANPDTTLKPFTASGTLSVPAGGGTVTVSPNTTNPPQPVNVNTTVTAKVATYQPSMFLNYIIAIQGIYPSRP